MRGLLTKDLRLMAGQKRFFIVVLGIAVLFFIAGQNEMFVVGYVTMLCAFFAISTIHYDEFNKGNTFLFTLPFTRKEYALEKYVFGILTGGTAWLVSSAVGAALAYTRGNMDMGEWVFSILVYVLFIFIMLDLMIPIELKFGAEKGRIASMLLFFAIFGILFLSMEISDKFGIDFSGMVETMNMGKLTLVLVVFALLLTAVSVTVSMKIMEKKQF